ncbi:RNA polymerase II transcription elongation factor SpEAF [Oleoguttula sp. CCFEE 5521]
MSTTEVLRHAAIENAERELRAAVSSQNAGLRALYDLTLLLQNNNTLASLCNVSADNPETVAWLNANSLDQGCHFDEASLPHPVVPQDVSVTSTETHEEQLILTTEPGSETTSTTTGPHASMIKPFTLGSAASTMTAAATQRSVDLLVPAEKESRIASKSPLLSITRRSQGSAPPAEIAPPAPEDEDNLTQATRERLHLETDTHPHAKTVHLPSKAVQEARLRERSEARHLKASTDVERASHLQVQGDLASSPSSTVGAHSAATPMLPQDSPDTSPDSEPAAVDVPEDLRPTPEERRVKVEHDKNLAAKKEEARKQALGDISTPDEQLRWEEREAAAREAEEQAARDDRGGPEPSTSDSSHQTEAAQAVADMQNDRRTALKHSSSRQHNDVRHDEPESEEDSITVVPRKAASSREEVVPVREILAGTGRDTVSATPSDLAIQPSERMTEQVNGTPSVEPRRRQSSIEPISPKSTRRDGRVVRMQEYVTPPRTRRPEYDLSPHASITALGELASLKGAAEDPERDYLEPLFRIQAHESGNINTQPLPDLIKSATKTLSTEDYFTATHERMDFRMLRRIYQLQNANKWPLRQMDKCKEPPAPVTHQDHLMAEMRWMGKDFRAERKMKKSVCTWLARRCADYVAADGDERMDMRVKVKGRRTSDAEVEDDGVPELEAAGESAPEDDSMPRTPMLGATLLTRLVVAPELADHVQQLQKSDTLRMALEDVPIWQPETLPQHSKSRMTQVSKFVSGKILPKQQQPSRKRSRYDYEDEAETEDAQPSYKRRRDEQDMQPDDSEIALFHSDNKHIRDRLHANNVFRPPSEFQMPSTPFYEFRNGSQWVWEDDQKLRKLAKDYSFNWSLISAEMALPSRFKSGMERRTPWECFERWVELETLPAEMRKTVYFKTWFQRLEQSQQAVERRYNAQVAAIQQAQQQSGVTAAQQHMPMRRRTLPSRVEKRKSTRHLWTVDAMRKLAKKREMAEYKKAESARAAAQRKSTQQAEISQQPRAPMLTPQEFSKKRYERDLQLAEMQRQHRLKMLEQQQRSLQMTRAGQPGQVNGAPNVPRPGTAGQAQMSANGQQHPAVNGQGAQQQRQGLPAPTRNGHLAVPGANTQGIPQAHMRSAVPMTQSAEMQRMAQASAQSRQSQYGGQQFPMPNASMISPVANTGSMTTQQQIASNQALLAAFQAQTQSHQQMPVQHQGSLQSNHTQSTQMNGQQHMSASPNMPPPPTPQGNSGQLSSGHVPAVIAIKNQLRARYPNMTEAELTNFATEQLKHQSQSSSQVRQSAMNAAAGLSNGVPSATTNMQAYGQNQQVYPSNPKMSNGVNGYGTGDASSQVNVSAQSPQHSYAQMMRQRQMQQMRMQQSPNTPHAQLANSPVVAHASPNVNPVSPAVQYQGVNNVPSMTARPSSRSNTPGMMQSPGALTGGLQGSPRTMQASAAR